MSDKIAPCLWFDGNARQAADFYVSLLPNSRIVEDAGIMVVFELAGRRFLALNGGPDFKFTPAVSMYLDCADQAEVDYDHRGRVDLRAITDDAIVPGADYYLCGPAPFMAAQRAALLELGVEPGRIHAEAFGTGGAPA